MSKSLEALKHLYAKLSCKSNIEEIDENLQEYEIVERDLKVLDILREKQVDLWLVDNCVIKEKKVDVPYIIENPEEKDVIWYNARFMGVLCEGWRMLSQEEWDLLRKVLL